MCKIYTDSTEQREAGTGSVIISESGTITLPYGDPVYPFYMRYPIINHHPNAIVTYDSQYDDIVKDLYPGEENFIEVINSNHIIAFNANDVLASQIGQSVEIQDNQGNSIYTIDFTAENGNAVTDTGYNLIDIMDQYGTTSIEINPKTVTKSVTLNLKVIDQDTGIALKGHNISVSYQGANGAALVAGDTGVSGTYTNTITMLKVKQTITLSVMQQNNFNAGSSNVEVTVDQTSVTMSVIVTRKATTLEFYDGIYDATTAKQNGLTNAVSNLKYTTDCMTGAAIGNDIGSIYYTDFSLGGLGWYLSTSGDWRLEVSVGDTIVENQIIGTIETNYNSLQITCPFKKGVVTWTLADGTMVQKSRAYMHLLCNVQPVD